MTDAEFKQWEPLLHKVINTHFHIYFDHRRCTTRPIDWDELFQEAAVALIQAHDRYSQNPDSYDTNETGFYYASVYRDIRRFIDKNRSPVLSKDWRSSLIRGLDVMDDVSRALNCVLDSEGGMGIENAAEGEGGRESQGIPECVLHEDWVHFCVTMLRDNLLPRDFEAIMDYMECGSMKSTGEKMGISIQRVHALIQRAIIRGKIILRRQEKHLEPLETKKLTRRRNSG